MEEQPENLRDFLSQMMYSIGNISARSANTMNLFQQMLKLNKVVNQLDQIKDQDNKSVQQFYRTFRGIFKQYQDQTNAEIGHQSGLENMSDEYIAEIKEKLAKMTGALTGLCNSIISNTQIHLLWYLMTPTKEEQQEADYMINYFNKTYEKKSTAKLYSSKDIFLKELKEFGKKSNPIIAFISLHNYAKQKEELLQSYKDIIDIKENNKEVKIQGIILQVDSENSYQNLQAEMKNEAQQTFNLVLTFDHYELYNEVFKLMNPQEFRRVIPSDEINLYYHTMKQKFFELHTLDYSKQDLFSFHPQKINLQKKLEEAIDLMKRRDIKVDKAILEDKVALRLARDIEMCYTSANGNEQDLVKSLLRLYTLESCFLYRFINGSMNTLNEDILVLIWDFVLLFRIALMKYDDSGESAIKITDFQAPKLYRGINLAQDYYKRIMKVGKIICLASFSSFTLKQEVAEQFLYTDQHFTKERASVIFQYEHKISSANFPQRPKKISHLGPFPVEEEYLLPPSYQFKIFKIDEPTDQIHFYKVYLTQGNVTSFN